jgi:hypothetical protein
MGRSRRAYDMRDYLDRQQREIACLECKVNSGGTTGVQPYSLPMFETVDLQLAYTFPDLAGATLISVVMETNPLVIGTDVTLSGSTLTFATNPGDGQRVFVIYKK